MRLGDPGLRLEIISAARAVVGPPFSKLQMSHTQYELVPARRASWDPTFCRASWGLLFLISLGGGGLEPVSCQIPGNARGRIRVW